jgi:hypothetical protein
VVQVTDVEPIVGKALPKRFGKSFKGSGRKRRYPRRQGEKNLEFPDVRIQETADGVAREPHSHFVHRRISTRA